VTALSSGASGPQVGVAAVPTALPASSQPIPLLVPTASTSGLLDASVPQPAVPSEPSSEPLPPPAAVAPAASTTRPPLPQPVPVFSGLPPKSYKPGAHDMFKPKNSKSQVWGTFLKLHSYPDAAWCTSCNMAFAYSKDGTTSNLTKHKELCVTEPKPALPSIEQSFERQRQLQAAGQAVFEDHLLDMIVMQNLPLSFTDGEWSRALFAAHLKSGLDVPASDKVGELLQAKYDKGIGACSLILFSICF
jgi:hypothetical protein